VNSGNANALTGPEGLVDVKTVCEAVARALDVPAQSVLSASTGVIGHRLPAHKIVAAAPALAGSLRPEPEQAAEAMMTTDTRIKLAGRSVEIGGKEVVIAALCKGSGMIAPSLATMIAVVTTDCAISPPALQAALGAAMKKSFNALTVDGDMSTNDVVFALANGLAGNAPLSDPGPDLDRFTAALAAVCEELAKEIAADGEGATKVVEVRVAVDLRAGNGSGVAWGCDLTYDYVKINADYTSLIVPRPDGGVAKDDRLANYSPTFKQQLLVEALGYIRRFAGTRCVVKYG